MTAHIWHTPTGWYWRGGNTNACGPFPTAAAATADALRLDLPADEYWNDNGKDV